MTHAIGRMYEMEQRGECSNIKWEMEIKEGKYFVITTAQVGGTVFDMEKNHTIFQF